MEASTVAEKLTEQQFADQYEGYVAMQVAREVYRALHPKGMHTNGPTRVTIEVSRLLIVLSKWRAHSAGASPDAVD